MQVRRQWRVSWCRWGQQEACGRSGIAAGERAGRPLFHGPLLPHAATLTRLLDALAADTLAPGAAAVVPVPMAEAVWRLAPQRALVAR